MPHESKPAGVFNKELNEAHALIDAWFSAGRRDPITNPETYETIGKSLNQGEEIHDATHTQP
jgi:hypothetical protein